MPSDVDIIELSDSWYQDPHAIYDRLRPHGPIHYIKLPDGIHGWLVIDFEVARGVLADHITFSKDLTAQRGRTAMHAGGAGDIVDTAVATNSLLFLDPPHHTRLRRLLTTAFAARAVNGMAPRIIAIADDLLDNLAGRPTADVIGDFAFELPVLVICELLGIPSSDRNDFRRWSHALLDHPDTGPERNWAARQLTGYIAGLIAERTIAPQQDLLTELIRAGDDNTITDAELISMTLLLLVAGHETTVGLIGNATRQLLLDPDLRHRVLNDPDLMPPFLEEVLRINGSLHLATLRYATAETEIAGRTIEPGQLVIVSLAAAGRDPNRHTDPDRVDLDRSDGLHLAFGHGVHYCLGAPLARMEAGIAIRELLSRFPDISLAEPAHTPTWRRSALVRCLVDLPVTLQPSIN